MPNKLLKGKKATERLHPRDARSPRHSEWRESISASMRKAKGRRRKAGLLSFPQVAVEYDLPVAFVKRKADLGEVRVVQSGARRYIRRSEADRIFGEPKGNAA